MKNSELIKQAVKKGFKIGYIDIENSPELSWHYGHHNINIGYDQLEVPSQVTSVAYRSFGSKETKVEEWDRPKTIKDIYCNHTKDQRLLKNVIPELNKFDLLIGQNLDAFDIKVMNGRAWVLGLPPVTTILSIDTLTNSRKVFRLSSHKLDAMAQQKGIGKKIKQDMQDCIQTAKGNNKVADRRLKYNKRDVIIGDRLALSQLDYYKLPKKLLHLLKLYIRTDNPTFCIPCAAEKQSRFNVSKKRISGGYRFNCDNCDYEWEIKK